MPSTKRPALAQLPVVPRVRCSALVTATPRHVTIASSVFTETAASAGRLTPLGSILARSPNTGVTPATSTPTGPGAVTALIACVGHNATIPFRTHLPVISCSLVSTVRSRVRHRAANLTDWHRSAGLLVGFVNGSPSRTAGLMRPPPIAATISDPRRSPRRVWMWGSGAHPAMSQATRVWRPPACA